VGRYGDARSIVKAVGQWLPAANKGKWIRGYAMPKVFHGPNALAALAADCRNTRLAAIEAEVRRERNGAPSVRDGNGKFLPVVNLVASARLRAELAETDKALAGLSPRVIATLATTLDKRQPPKVKGKGAK
jgi:hypothetical protein